MSLLDQVDPSFIFLVLGLVVGFFIDAAYKSLFTKVEGGDHLVKGKVWEEAKGLDVSKLDSILTRAFPMDDVKMVLVVREDLKMGKGKMAAQCGHATLEAFKLCEQRYRVSKFWKKALDSWSWAGQKKICVKVNSEELLLEAYKKAKSMQIPCEVIEDAGLTQIESGSRTVLGIGPAPGKMIDQVTG